MAIPQQESRNKAHSQQLEERHSVLNIRDPDQMAASLLLAQSCSCNLVSSLAKNRQQRHSILISVTMKPDTFEPVLAKITLSGVPRITQQQEVYYVLSTQEYD